MEKMLCIVKMMLFGLTDKLLSFDQYHKKTNCIVCLLTIHVMVQNTLLQIFLPVERKTNIIPRKGRIMIQKSTVCGQMHS